MQAYHSPLHIIPKARRDQLDELNPKMLRRELLLRLELSGSTTLEIDGRHYDRNEIIRAVDELQQHLPEHVQLFRNKPLLQFLESGDLSFFEHPSSWKDLQDPIFSKWLQPYFTEQYAYCLYKFIAEKGFRSINKLRTLHGSAFKLPATYRDPANFRAFRYLQDLLQEAETKVNLMPRRRVGKILLDKNLKHYLTPHLLNVIRNLNDNFLAVKIGFANWSQNLLHFTFTEENEYKKFTRASLELLEIAAQLNFAVTGDESINRLATNINRYLVYQTSESLNAPKWSTRLIAFAMFFFAFFAIWFSHMQKRASPNTYSVNQSFLEANATAKRKDALKAFLVGDWDTPLSTPDSVTYGHIFTFYKDGKGESSYYFPQDDAHGSCFLSIPFDWSVEAGSKNVPDQLQLELLDTHYRQANCLEVEAGTEYFPLFQQLNQSAVNPKIIISFVFSDVSSDPASKHSLQAILSPPHLWPKSAE